MIIPNGTIQFRHKDPGGIKESTGFPIPSSRKTWGDPIKCQYLKSKANIMEESVSGSNYKKANYDIYINDNSSVSIAETVLLKNDNGTTIGEYKVIYSDELRAVNQILIVV